MIVAAAVAVPAIAFAGVSTVGSPFRIDDDSGPAPFASTASVAMRGDGSFAVAWSVWDFYSGVEDIRLRLFAPGGIARGPSVSARTSSSGIARMPQISMNAAGDFAVAWEASGPDGQTMQAHARVFHADGTPLGGEFRLDDDAHALLLADPNAEAAGYSVALGADDRLLAAWTALASTARGLLNQDLSNMGLFVRRFSAAGAPLDAAANINQGIDLLTELSSPTVAIAEDGHYLAAWAASGEECTPALPGAVGCGLTLQPLTLRFRLFEASGTPKGPQTTALPATVFNQGTAGRQQVAMNPSGSFVLAWQASTAQGEIHSQSYTPQGLPRQARADLPGVTGDAWAPATAIDAQGDYLVAFRSQVRMYVTGPQGGIQPLGAAFPTPIDNLRAAAMDASNGFVVVGMYLSSASPTTGVFAQLYSFAR
jgi:hypothetical protein